MNYRQTLDYLYTQLPMFHRIGAAAYKADLKNTLAICKLLGNPERKFKAVHIAGTNGKGSSSHMLAAVLQKAGYKTGLYTSPHLLDFRERIRINGKMIPKKKVTDFVKKHRAAFDKIQPSFFEWTVGLAFEHFAENKVDIAIIEVGLGGRLDSTNVIRPLVSLITNIGFDHMNLLGDSLPKIAAEKAGIIKPLTPLVVSQYQKETAKVFLRTAEKVNAPLVFASKEYELLFYTWNQQYLHVSFREKKSDAIEEIKTDLNGTYQVKNLLGVLKTLELLQKKGFKKIKPEVISSALKNVQKLTGLMGRWQVLSKDPLTIADTGHNSDGIKEVLANLERYSYKKLHFVLGVVNDKDVSGILKLLPATALYYFTRASVPRALPEKELLTLAKKHRLKGQTFPDVKSAVKSARQAAAKDDLIFVGGSTFVVADAL
ncbi:MAG: bifunctional folylpolyglutamate synthase/dihydrofolate synthase [Bacteroidia bacterium]